MYGDPLSAGMGASESDKKAEDDNTSSPGATISSTSPPTLSVPTEGSTARPPSPVSDLPRRGSGLKNDEEYPIRKGGGKGIIVKESPPTAKGHGFPDTILLAMQLHLHWTQV